MKSSILNKIVLKLVYHLFLDDRGILRINGRLSNSRIEYDQRFPILLLANNQVARLLIKLEHAKLYHLSAHTVLANTRMRFWPMTGLSQVKYVILC